MQVKKAEVNLLINGDEKQYKAGDTEVLKSGDVVCFLSGDGRILILGEHYKKQISKHNKSCKHLPSEDGSPVDYVASIKSTIVSVFADVQEKSVNGVSRKGMEQKEFTKPILLHKNTKFVAIKSKAWGPLPVTLKIIDKNGKVKEEMVNEDEIETEFIVLSDLVEGSCTITVCNAFDETLLHSKVEEKKQDEK
jgi:hypothetical protein